MSLQQLMDLHGRTAIVTGGSRGLGLQIAEALGELGAQIAITARKADELEEAKAHLAKLGVACATFTADLGKPADPARMVDAVMQAFGRIDILVNNAGATWGADMADYPLEAWQKLVNLNLTGMFLTSQRVGKVAMIPARYGKIVNLASVTAFKGAKADDMKAIAYGTTKGGVVSFTRALAAEWGPLGITVNAIAPGFFPSKMTKGTLDRIGERPKLFVRINALDTSDGPRLAGNLSDATEAFATSAFCREYFGAEFVEHYAASRRIELKHWNDWLANQVTSFELARYFETT